MDQPSTIRERFVLAGGVHYHVLCCGSGPPLLLVHGLVGSVRNWRLNLEAFARDATVYAVDLANMGQSDRVRDLDASLAATADRLLVLMDALGVERADLAGHSHGATMAMMFAIRHPARVRSLILFAPANPFSRLSLLLVRFFRTALGGLLARMIPYLPNPLLALGMLRMYGDPRRIPKGSLAGYTDGLRIPGTIPHILNILKLWFVDMDRLHAGLSCLANTPTLLVWGDRDRAVALASSKSLQQIPHGSSLVVIHGAGHIAFEEMPAECNLAMHRWLTGEMPTATASS